MVEQFGLAMIPFLEASLMACGLTSGTTSGTSGSMRHALELSITVAPALAADGANSNDRAPPAEKRAISTPLNELWSSFCTGISSPLKRNLFPTDRSDARNLISSTGKSRSSKTLIIIWPTAPVAPATATLKPLPMATASSLRHPL